MTDPVAAFAAPVPTAPLKVLKDVFGFENFRGLQEDVISALMAGEDALVLMPTGGGKSLCYQIPALCREGLGIVVSPLIALMDDQVAALKQLGVKAAALHSELELHEKDQLWDDLRNRRLDLLYISPERLLSPGILDFLRQRPLSLIAIDEAHCVSAWGHEFRPEYRALSCLSDAFPGVPRIALTATADPRTRDDIVASLAMPQARIFTASFHRPNLVLEARPKLSESRQLLEALERYRGEGAAIVYCGSRRRTERLAATLREKGQTALAFHAGLSALEKRAVLHRFRSGEPMTVVATIAFGMGIDRPDVRLVVHVDMPASPEAYYQQIGRAGRDGETAHTLLLYGGEDMARARYWLEQSQAPESEKRVMQGRLENMIALSETTGCRTEAILECFGEKLPENCGHCDNCRQPVPTFDGRVAAQKVLSAVYRTGERFGAVVVTNVLRGKKNEMIERHALDKLSVFGIGADHGENWWRTVIRQLIARGALKMHGDYGALGLDRTTARPLLQGQMPLPLREDVHSALRSKGLRAKEGVSREGEGITLSAAEEERFQRLKQWRLAEAREQEIPPYVIFHDAVLKDVARLVPTDLQALGSIKGVGSSKLERYGKAVLTVLTEASAARPQS
ncbi:DNA helicase RecQ [Oecophyllibacter saccharovorans]|uniref:DNA helicase RecQ n=1 Tax=Oecophyllibacter saccharovorans TaxID=2558360 RepID=UPI00116B9D6F|nr:DNA helicase RecQ [Oecophyllibacter saccharovorans]TPW34694.1 DNA helicase RecQ [Oecophyllibacter saccharovorans]